MGEGPFPRSLGATDAVGSSFARRLSAMLAKLSLSNWHLWPSAASRAGFLRAWWNRLTLARQFIFAGSAVLIVGMGVLGIWVSGQIEAGVIRNSAAATAL